MLSLKWKRTLGERFAINSSIIGLSFEGLAFALREDTKLQNVNNSQQRLGCMDLFHCHSLR